MRRTPVRIFTNEHEEAEDGSGRTGRAPSVSEESRAGIAASGPALSEFAIRKGFLAGPLLGNATLAIARDAGGDSSATGWKWRRLKPLLENKAISVRRGAGRNAPATGWKSRRLKPLLDKFPAAAGAVKDGFRSR